jgi:phospholipid transport system substrate-binding protein
MCSLRSIGPRMDPLLRFWFRLEMMGFDDLLMPFARRLTLLSVLWFCMSSASASASDSGAGATSKPLTVVESLHTVLLECMKGACGPNFKGRYERINAQLDGIFDVPLMARMTVGKEWESLSNEERTVMIELTRSLSAANYAANFESYGGQRFDTLGEEPAARGTVLVKTEFVQPSDENVKFDYRLRQIEREWLIIDITLDGMISEITMRRADYSSVIERKGFQHLVKALEKKIAKLGSE